jgi:rRNA maturation endonuclease Nob1
MAEQKLTGEGLEGAGVSGEKSRKAVNQYFKETLNKLSTSIDLTNPNGLEMSAAFDKYVEKIIKPIYPKGAQIRQTSTVDDKAGLRTVDWSFRDAGNKIQQAVQAAVGNFVQSWGRQRGLIDGEGNPVQGAGSIPMQVGGITSQVFNGTTTRILNPRTAASVAAASMRAGGSYALDKNSGKSTWSVPDDALTWEGKNLSRSLRAEVREGDKKWLEGRVALASLAEGASPANAEERALAMNNRNFRLLLAKHKAMTPEQENEEFKLRLARRRRQAEFQKKYEEEHPDDPLVKVKRERARKTKNRRRAAAVKSSIHRTIATVLGAAMMAVGVLAKILTNVVEVAGTLRKRQSDAARYNLPSGAMQTFTNIENSMFGLEKGTFSNIFGSVMRFADPAMPSFSSGVEKAAAFLQKDVPDLIGFVTGGTHHPDQMMYELLADFMNKTAAKRGGVLQRDTVSEAVSVNQAVIADLFGDSFAALFLRMYERLGGAAVEGREYTAEQIKESLHGTIADYPVIKTTQVTETAAEKGVQALGELKSLWESIKHGIFSHILAHMSELVALVRNIARTVLGAYNPQWAAAEDAAAKAKAYADTVRLENNIEAHKGDVLPFMEKSKYKDPVEYTKEVTRIINERDVEAVTKNLGLSWEEFQVMVSETGFALQNARKLQEIQENNDITMGKLQHQTAWTGGTSDAEMSNSELESYYALLYSFRSLASADIADMFNDRVAGPGSLLQYNGSYNLETRLINDELKRLLAELADRFRNIETMQIDDELKRMLEGGGDADIPNRARLSSVFPKVLEAVNGVSSIEQAVPALKEAGVTFKDMQGIIALIAANRGSKPTFDLSKIFSPNYMFNEHPAAVSRYNMLGELSNTMAAAAQYLDVPDFTPAGNREAARIVTQAQGRSAARLNETLIHHELRQQLADVYGIAREAASEILKSSTGTVYTPVGSDRELKFEITVNGLPSGKPATLKGVINNEGGMSGTHTWADGGISIRSITESYQPTPQ